MHHLHIASACLFNAQGALLTVRKQGTPAWMLPGGKRMATKPRCKPWCAS